MKASKKRLVSFQAHWCKPCHEMRSVLDELEKDGWEVERVDVDAPDQRISKWSVMSVPQYFAVDQTGEPVGQLIGKVSKERLVEILTQ